MTLGAAFAARLDRGGRPNAQHLVRNALDPANATPLVCRPVPPLVG